MHVMFVQRFERRVGALQISIIIIAHLDPL